MATFVYTEAMHQIAIANLTMAQTTTYKMILVNASQAAFKADANVGQHLTAAEIGSSGAVTNYQRGYAGTGRTATTTTVSVASNVVEVIFSGNIVWTNLGGTVNDTIVGCALIKEITNDAGSLPIAYWDISPSVTTNGSNFTITISGTGNITFTT